MYQTDRGTYSKGNICSQLGNSCLGRTAITAAIVALILVAAHYTVPSEQQMREKAVNGIALCIISNIEHDQDAADDIVRNMAAVVTRVDSTGRNIEQIKMFNKLNRIAVYPHTFYSTVRIHNYAHAGGVRVAVGLFGIVFPTVSTSDYLLRTDAMQKDYKDVPLGRHLVDEGADPGADYDDDFNPYEIR